MDGIREEETMAAPEDFSSKGKMNTSERKVKDDRYEEKPTISLHPSENEKSLPVQARILAPAAPSPSVESQVRKMNSNRKSNASGCIPAATQAWRIVINAEIMKINFFRILAKGLPRNNTLQVH